MKGATFIPMVGMFAGGADTKTKTLVVRLDAAGKVAGYDYSVGGFSAVLRNPKRPGRFYKSHCVEKPEQTAALAIGIQT